jgi:prepilin-type N-terminal cleavage/methylation domain-containing protein
MYGHPTPPRLFGNGIPLRSRRCRRASRGFTLVETLIVIALIAITSLVAAPFIQGYIRRERLRSCVREVYSIVLAGRMQAVKRNAQVIIQFDLPNHRVISWADNLPYNYIQDAGEDTLSSYSVPKNIYFRAAPNGAAVDDADSVAFDTYAGNTARVDMIVWRGDGTILPPQGGNSQPPARPSAYTTVVPSGSINCAGGCRGVYLSDNPLTGDVANRNTFRISVDDFGPVGKASLLKWVPTSEGANAGEVNYVPSPWGWAGQ